MPVFEYQAIDPRGKKVGPEDIIEKEADEMAQNGLIPKRIWDRKQISGKASTAKVYALAEKLKIHPAIIAGRVRFEQNNYKLLSRHVGNKQIRKKFANSFIANAS